MENSLRGLFRQTPKSADGPHTSIELKNITRNTILATKVYTASRFLEKIGGLLLRPKPLEKNEALAIHSIAPWIHTFFMKQAIDCVFLNRENRVVALERLSPWRLGKIYWRANKVVELPQGVISKSKTEIADQIEID